ncbi:MAG: hypothetical protein ACP5MH_09865 [Thermoproteus sp.]
MKAPYIVLVVLSGIVAAFFIYLGVDGIDVVVSIFALIYWAVAPFVRPLPKPLGIVHTAIGLALLAAFAYFATLRIMAILGI